MPRKANFIFEVRIRISEAFTLDSIVRNPRTFKPKDVQSACQNNEVAILHGDPPADVVSIAMYVMTDFFAMSHATGLYNRQKLMWEALSKVSSIEVNQLSSGVFNKKPLPIFDFSFLDYKGKPLLLANLVAAVPEKTKPVDLLKSFISRASNKSATGALSFWAEPIPPEVLEFAQKQTYSEDPVSRYESVMPGLNKPFDLLEMSSADLTEGSQDASLGLGPDDAPEYRTVFQLLLPDLKKKTTVPVRQPSSSAHSKAH